LLFEINNLPPISDDYYKNRNEIPKVSRQNLEYYVAGNRVAGKVNGSIIERNIYLNNNKSPRQYFPFDPFIYK